MASAKPKVEKGLSKPERKPRRRLLERNEPDLPSNELLHRGNPKQADTQTKPPLDIGIYNWPLTWCRAGTVFIVGSGGPKRVWRNGAGF
jgi:hypothetical protein